MSRTVKCPKCQSRYATMVKFCVRDGTPLGAHADALDQDRVKCPKCGSEWLGAKFCPVDGTALTG